jgi:hypothetical protein
MSGRIQTGKTEPIRALILNANWRPIVGLTDVRLSLERGSDGKFIDFNDKTFKASGWTSRTQVMTGAVPSPQPTDTTGDTDGATGVITDMADTDDFKVGDYATPSGGFPDTNIAYRITAVTSSSITLDINSDSSANNITVLGYHYPGYEYDFDTSAITNPEADDKYFAYADTPSGSNTPLKGEVPVGGWADNLDASIATVQALCGKNLKLFDTVHDKYGNLKEATIRGYASKADLEADQNPLFELALSGTYSGFGKAIEHIRKDST